MNRMTSTIAESITRAASKQTHYTIRFLVDRERIDDVYRSYRYFRWVDDTLDAETMTSADRRMGTPRSDCSGTSSRQRITYDMRNTRKAD